jgi:hypothetical protein
VAKRVLQRHHELYGDGIKDNEELLVELRKGEHYIATRMRQYFRKSVSRNFVNLLHYLIAKWELDGRIE